ncbi:hypothetical protein [Ensifer sp. B1-9]|uniref:hypothetical protein n=1 Tax=Ensifer sp. B1-9 TaxID=3141455 RepID=UPI003D21DEB0
MKNLLRTMAKAVRKSVFGELTHDQVAVEFVPTADDEINDLLARVKAFNRVPLHQPTVEERKKEADTMRDLKKWISKLSDNDRAIVIGRKPWEIMNHMLGIVPIDGVVAVGRGASYDFAPTRGKRNDFSETFASKAANENRAAAPQPIARWNPPTPKVDAKPDMLPTYDYKPPRPPASFMAKFA